MIKLQINGYNFFYWRLHYFPIDYDIIINSYHIFYELAGERIPNIFGKESNAKMSCYFIYTFSRYLHPPAFCYFTIKTVTEISHWLWHYMVINRKYSWRNINRNEIVWYQHCIFHCKQPNNIFLGNNFFRVILIKALRVTYAIWTFRDS